MKKQITKTEYKKIEDGLKHINKRMNEKLTEHLTSKTKTNSFKKKFCFVEAYVVEDNNGNPERIMVDVTTFGLTLNICEFLLKKMREDKQDINIVTETFYSLGTQEKRVLKEALEIYAELFAGSLAEVHEIIESKLGEDFISKMTKEDVWAALKTVKAHITPEYDNKERVVSFEYVDKDGVEVQYFFETMHQALEKAEEKEKQMQEAKEFLKDFLGKKNIKKFAKAVNKNINKLN